MQMLSQFKTSVRDRLAARRGDEAAAATAAKPASAELLSPPKPAGGVSASQDSRHTIALTTAYGDLVVAEDVGQAEFGAALRRIHDEAIPRASAVIVLDGMTHTRNSFLEFVREFNDWEARQRTPHAA